MRAGSGSSPTHSRESERRQAACRDETKDKLLSSGKRRRAGRRRSIPLILFPPVTGARSRMTHRIELGGKDIVLLLVLTLAWGINWPVMKIGVQDFPPMSFRAICVALGLPVLWLILRVRGQSLVVQRKDWGEMVMLGLTNMALWFVLVIIGVRLLSSGRAAILGYTMPIWTALLGLLLYRERPSLRLGIGIAGAAVAVVLLLASELSAMAGRPLGTVVMLLAALIWAYGTHRMRRRRLSTGVMAITFWSLVIALALCTTLAMLTEHDQWTRAPNTGEWWAIAYNAVIILGISQMIWFRLASILPPVVSGLSVMLIPVIGLFSGMAMLGERPAWQDFAALGFILVAMATVLLPARRS